MRFWCHRILFVVASLGLSWLGMMAVHELGHVIAAMMSGGTVVRIVLHPAAISRTDVSPNPVPLLVAWSGPLLGSLIPCTVMMLLHFVQRYAERMGLAVRPALETDSFNLRGVESEFRRLGTADSCNAVAADRRADGGFISTANRKATLAFLGDLCQFFAGFCCIANGAYLGIGAFDGIGDAGDIQRAGSHVSLLILFGVMASAAGFLFWHRLGSPRALFRTSTPTDAWLARGLFATLVLVVVVECLLSPT